MPVSPAMAEDLAGAVRALYDDAELAVIELLRDALAEGIDSPLWAEIKLRSIGDLREAVERVTDALQRDADGAVREALTVAYGRGRQAAVAELGALDEGRRAQARRQLPNAPAVDRLAASWVADTRPLHARITRAVADVFRDTVIRVSSGVLLGTTTRRQASARALTEFARRGVTFTDRSGRAWNAASYAEMAVRSVTARAAVDGHVDALTDLGVGLVIVSDAPLECPLCAPWEGEVLALAGPDGPHTVRAEHAIDQPRNPLARRRTVAVHVAGSLLEARRRGLFHPNCRHSLSVYLPGVTTRPQAPPHPGGATYEDTQRQRYYERQVRAWKRRAAAAMDDAGRARANQRVRDYQARIRQLTADKELPRKRQREQIGTAH